MKKVFLTLTLISSLVVFTASCKEKKDTPAEQIEEAFDDAGDKIEEGAEEIEDEIDDMTR